jgi:hypothetical protein
MPSKLLRFITSPRDLRNAFNPEKICHSYKKADLNAAGYNSTESLRLNRN